MGQDLFVGPPERPDKYRLVCLEGSGGEASLWRAEVDLAGARETVAVKVLRPEHHDDLARISARWAEQAELLRFVTHPSVVGVREHFEGHPPHPGAERSVVPAPADPALYLVMNWVSGLPLRDWLLLHPGREGTVTGLRLLGQVAEVLEMLHAGRVTPSGRPVVHGDLSPGNIMVGDEGLVVLVDFGLVRLASHRTRAAVGTPGFAAPEVWSRGEYTPAADRYSFAALGFYLMFGTPPPGDEEQLAEQLFAHPFLVGTPPEQAEQILRGFSADPAERPGVAEWLRLLRGGASSSARTVGSLGGTRSSGTTSPGGRTDGSDHTHDRTSSRFSRPAPGDARVTSRARGADTDGADAVEAELADCRDGPAELVKLALTGRRWAVESARWARGRGGRSYRVKLRDRLGDWVLVEMRLRNGDSRLVWASGAGGAMTECLGELADWLTPI